MSVGILVEVLFQKESQDEGNFQIVDMWIVCDAISLKYGGNRPEGTLDNIEE